LLGDLHAIRQLAGAASVQTFVSEERDMAAGEVVVPVLQDTGIDTLPHAFPRMPQQSSDARYILNR